jgi:predicted PurR-regulated permease PerM
MRRAAAGGVSTGRNLELSERIVRVYGRTVLSLTAILIGVFVLLYLFWLTRQIIVWLAIAIFLAVAIDPLVLWFQRHGVPSRGLAVLAALLVVVGALVGIGALIVPTLVTQIDDLATALPKYVDDLTSGRGPLGFLERDYHVVERVQQRVQGGGAGNLAVGVAGGALQVAASVLSAITAIVTISVMVVFLLLGGPRWVESFYAALPPESRPRWRRIGGELYHSVGGYVRGNLAISVIAGVSAAIVLLVLGVPYAIALALVVAIFDLVPLVGATIGASLVFVVAVFHSVTAGVVWLIFVVVYQQVENHLIQPVVYGRAVQLPAFAVLLAVLVGAKLAGVVGALGAIPAASAIQIVAMELIRQRRHGRLLRREPL